MATDKKHIAVYLAPEVEQALVAFCERKGLISKKGTMYSAGVNVALASFFGVADVEVSNTPLDFNNILDKADNIPVQSIGLEASPGKLESAELPKVDNGVAEQLQNELSNLKTENERLQTDYAKLLESSTVVTNKLREDVREVRSQLETECAEREKVEAELSDLKQKSVTARELPDAADLLNRLKAKRKKPSATLADVEALLELLDESY